MGRSAGTKRWITIGGGIEPHETPAEAGHRECNEETGLQVRLTDIVGVFGGQGFWHTYPNGDQVAFTVIAFKAVTVGGKLRPDGSEIIDLRYFSAKELAELSLDGCTRELVNAAFAAARLSPTPDQEW